MKTSAKNLKMLAARYPFSFTLLFLLVGLGVDFGFIFGGQYILPSTYVGITLKVAQAVLALGALVWLGWMKQAGFNGPASWRSLSLLWLPALLALLYLASALVTPISDVNVLILASVSVLLAGLEEEARFRGVILQALLPGGAVRAALLSSLFFGLVHLSNFFTHLPPLFVLAQVVGAFLLGFGLAICRLRTRTIWPLIIFHALYDLPANLTLFSSGGAAAARSMLSTLSPLAALGVIFSGALLACYGLFLLRPQHQLAQSNETSTAD